MQSKLDLGGITKAKASLHKSKISVKNTIALKVYYMDKYVFSYAETIRNDPEIHQNSYKLRRFCNVKQSLIRKQMIQRIQPHTIF